MKNLYDNKNLSGLISGLVKSKEAKYILKHGQLIMVFIIVIVAVVISHTITLITNHAERTLTELGIGYGGYVDKDYYCKSINCGYIYQIENSNSGTIFNIHTNEVELVDDPPYYIRNGMELFLPISYQSDVYYVSTDGYLLKLLLSLIGVYIILQILMLKMIDGILVIERDDCLSSLHNKESDLQHNILFNITANINHEVNSPLLVIKSVIEEMLLELDDMYVQVDKCSGRRECEAMVEFKRNMDELMSLANESVISIDSAIRPLSDYKSIKFTNGDRNVYMLVDIATKMLRRTNITTFKTIIIDNELKKYSIMHDDGLTNGFFLNLMINHVKNSLEAKSSRLEVTLHDRDETHLYIYVTDNGNGVAPEMIPGLYEPNVTSKANIEEYRRGVGLYLSKLLITKKYGGDDTFISSTPNVATTFCIKVRYEDFKFYKEDIDEENTI